MDKLMTLCEAMIHYDRGDAKRIHHFLKVHAFAKQIGLEEGLDAETQFILEAAAYVHDIGIHQGEIKYGRNDGMIQQELGPKEALPMLKRLHFTQAESIRIDRLTTMINRIEFHPLTGFQRNLRNQIINQRTQGNIFLMQLQMPFIQLCKHQYPV